MKIFNQSAALQFISWKQNIVLVTVRVLLPRFFRFACHHTEIFQHDITWDWHCDVTWLCVLTCVVGAIVTPLVSHCHTGVNTIPTPECCGCPWCSHYLLSSLYCCQSADKQKHLWKSVTNTLTIFLALCVFFVLTNKIGKVDSELKADNIISLRSVGICSDLHTYVEMLIS